ncbi:3D domain-containing protein [Sinobaca sp. H24]|uniref:3D domain-containing protein n=1 Tax=Sinobaca sp. H24 TaxID=2923376 RepID=UPI0020794E8D|nr:3D domain-containing protein [Sinobaca sp. H24]
MKFSSPRLKTGIVTAAVGTLLFIASPADSDAASTDSYIQQGQSNEAVVELQEDLQSLGLYDYKIDGIFGSITASGVKELQASADINVDGVVGPNTRSALENSLDSGSDVAPASTTKSSESESSKEEAPAEEKAPSESTSSESAPKEKEAVASANTSSEQTSSPEGQSMTMEATAYTAGCAGCSGITANGTDLRNSPNKKVIAVDPSVIPLGSKVHVEGYGTAIAADTGGAIKGNRIDLHVPTKSDAFSFGRQSVKVTVLN